MRGARGGGAWLRVLAPKLVNPSAQRPGAGHWCVVLCPPPGSHRHQCSAWVGAGEREGARIPLALCSLALSAALGEAGA